MSRSVNIIIHRMVSTSLWYLVFERIYYDE